MMEETTRKSVTYESVDLVRIGADTHAKAMASGIFVGVIVVSALLAGGVTVLFLYFNLSKTRDTTARNGRPSGLSEVYRDFNNFEHCVVNNGLGDLTQGVASDLAESDAVVGSQESAACILQRPQQKVVAKVKACC
jgi:hypothetical protein